MVEKITIWRRLVNKKNAKTGEKWQVWEHNHIEDGWVETEKPVPKTPEQKISWDSAKWTREYGHLIDAVVHRCETP